MINLSTKARPYIGSVILTCALLTAGGIYSATRMPSGVYPEVTFPRVAVVARLPDSDVTQMEVKVTKPLEDAVSGVLGVSRVRSKSIRGGSELSIDFTPGTDMRRAETLIWNRIGAKRSELPPNVELTVEQMTPSVFPIMSVVLIGGNNSDTKRDPEVGAKLRDYAEYQLAPLIKTIPDVLYANVAGGDVREVEVIARPDDLLAAGLSAADLADQITQQSNLHPVGRTEGQPFAFQIIVNNQPETVRQIEEMVVSTRKDQPLRVRDVASVKVLHKDRGLSIGFDQRDAVVITVFRRLGGNTVNISRDLRNLLDKNQLTLPAGADGKRPPRDIQAVVVYDQSSFVTTAVHNVRDAIVIGSLFSVLILLAFLRSWRAVLISALAIPTTLAITFLFLYWSGETLNLMSLGGLAVAIGLIIDDTVVVVENIARHLSPARHGASSGTSGTEPAPAAGGFANPPTVAGPAPEASGRGDAIDKASGEITGAVLGSTLTTVLVFLPLALIVGVYGQFFAALSWSLSIAVLVSMVISLTLVPVVAAKFLGRRPMPGPGRLYHFFEHIYEWGLTVALRFPWAALALSVLAVAVGAILVIGVPDLGTQREAGKPPPPPLVKGLETGLMPAMDEGAFVVDYRAPSGTPLEQTEKMARDIEKILAKSPDVDAYVRRTGAELGLFATQTSRGDIQVVLRPAEDDPISLLSKPVRPAQEDLEKELKGQGQNLEDPATREAIRHKYRRRPLPKVMEEVEDQIKDLYSEHQLKVEVIQIMADELSDLSGANKPIEVKLFGPDQKVLRALADQVGETLEKKGKGRGIKEVSTNVFAGNPDLVVQLDAAKAERHGLKPDAVARQLRTMFLGQIAAKVQESSARLTDVRVRYPDAFRFGPGRFDADFVRRQWILLPPGAPPVQAGQPSGLTGPSRAVPLSEMATVTPVRSPDQLWREGQQPAIFVTAELNEEEAGLGSVVADVRAWMSDLPLPAGYRWELGGHYLRQQEAFDSLLVVMLVAALLVFIMLAIQFQSVSLPVLIFLTQPLSLVSGLLALWLTHTPLNVSSYMGAILLIGLDMKNGILLVEYIQQLRGEGMDLRPALIEAGRTRFRPILMTSLAAILGLAPLALGIGPGAQMQQPLAIMVIGGLTANMLFTRMMIPVGYLVLERTRGKKTAGAVPAARRVSVSARFFGMLRRKETARPVPAAPPSSPPVPSPRGVETPV
ncbi:efflux RND transporter permease subunit [Fimbriiglobus ruber]|uniref:Cobalt-zinc-cadmium resistance protein CzcA / Cation efflux system protein CusA n=1 Tax=Fimbriiglobus ruber TaxID=1908690 RepID=A0A225DSH1_9BACT|nr:efflux RND transporter permease subunit [Fimbriiglobus ruber]OWK39067.1 Cobalt-zinc-cadmium resistance protein CzcA / Cation efflux system protein CusA [Fimbriiglobus ruber]